MEMIFLALPIALLLGGLFLAAFFWAVHRGQYDDLDTPAFRVLFEDDVVKDQSDARTSSARPPSAGKASK